MKSRIRLLLLILMVLVFFSALQVTYAMATCNSFECALAGGKCVNNECIMPPKPTPTPTPGPTQTSVPSSSVIVTVQKLYCDTRICVIIVSPPDYLNKLVEPIK